MRFVASILGLALTGSASASDPCVEICKQDSRCTSHSYCKLKRKTDSWENGHCHNYFLTESGATHFHTVTGDEQGLKPLNCAAAVELVSQIQTFGADILVNGIPTSTTTTTEEPTTTTTTTEEPTTTTTTTEEPTTTTTTTEEPTTTTTTTEEPTTTTTTTEEPTTTTTTTEEPTTTTTTTEEPTTTTTTTEEPTTTTTTTEEPTTTTTTTEEPTTTTTTTEEPTTTTTTTEEPTTTTTTTEEPTTTTTTTEEPTTTTTTTEEPTTTTTTTEEPAAIEEVIVSIEDDITTTTTTVFPTVSEDVEVVEEVDSEDDEEDEEEYDDEELEGEDDEELEAEDDEDAVEEVEEVEETPAVVDAVDEKVKPLAGVGTSVMYKLITLGSGGMQLPVMLLATGAVCVASYACVFPQDIRAKHLNSVLALVAALTGPMRSSLGAIPAQMSEAYTFMTSFTVQGVTDSIKTMFAESGLKMTEEQWNQLMSSQAWIDHVNANYLPSSATLTKWAEQLAKVTPDWTAIYNVCTEYVSGTAGYVGTTVSGLANAGLRGVYQYGTIVVNGGQEFFATGMGRTHILTPLYKHVGSHITLENAMGAAKTAGGVVSSFAQWGWNGLMVRLFGATA